MLYLNHTAVGTNKREGKETKAYIDSVYMPQEVRTFLKLINWVARCLGQIPAVKKCLLDAKNNPNQKANSIVNGVIGLR